MVELVALLRERARRAAQVTREGQIARIQRLGREAEEEGDRNAALRAEDLVNKLANLYQDTQVVIGPGAVQVLVVNTGVPSRDPLPALAAVNVTPVDSPRSPREAQAAEIAGRALSEEGSLTLEEVLYG
ncbi:MAG: hypothetical protein QM704_25460 [Anaeromyxobacteraceae bacterium]